MALDDAPEAGHGPLGVTSPAGEVHHRHARRVGVVRQPLLSGLLCENAEGPLETGQVGDPRWAASNVDLDVGVLDALEAEPNEVAEAVVVARRHAGAHRDPHGAPPAMSPPSSRSSPCTSGSSPPPPGPGLEECNLVCSMGASS